MPTKSLTRAALVLAMLSCTAPAFAQYGWGRSGWDRSGWDRGGWGSSRLDSPRSRLSSGSERDSREGKVDTAQFMADDAGDQLGKGSISVAPNPDRPGDTRDAATYESAVIDQLIKAGYNTQVKDEDSAQIAQLRIVRDVLMPEEGKRKPVSGEMMVGTGTYGSSVGMAVAVDLSKPLKALVSTRLEARVIDRATGKALWEGRAEMASREGDSRWSEQAIATKLAAALFAQFPSDSAKQLSAR